MTTAQTALRKSAKTCKRSSTQRGEIVSYVFFCQYSCGSQQFVRSSSPVPRSLDWVRHFLVGFYKKRLHHNHIGTAYVHGMKYSRGEFVILMDADMSHDVRFVCVSSQFRSINVIALDSV